MSLPQPLPPSLEQALQELATQLSSSQQTYNSQKLTLPDFAHSFVVSVQPVTDGPLDNPLAIVLQAQAAVAGGADALRIEGLANLQAVRPFVQVPIIGIIKRDLPDSPLRISPFDEDIISLARAGADIVAFDGTDRGDDPQRRQRAIALCHQEGVLAMADCSNAADGDFCAQAGCDIIGTTLSGYTGGEIPLEADWELLSYFVQQGYFTMAEGRYNSPTDVRKALALGAKAVTVGTVLTRLEVMTSKFKASFK